MSPAPVNPLAQLRAAEARLVAAISSAAGALDAVGTTNVDDALAGLRASAEGAAVRLHQAMHRMGALVHGVLEQADALASEVTQSLACYDLPALPGSDAAQGTALIAGAVPDTPSAPPVAAEAARNDTPAATPGVPADATSPAVAAVGPPAEHDALKATEKALDSELVDLATGEVTGAFDGPPSGQDARAVAVAACDGAPSGRGKGRRRG